MSKSKKTAPKAKINRHSFDGAFPKQQKCSACGLKVKHVKRVSKRPTISRGLKVYEKMFQTPSEATWTVVTRTVAPPTCVAKAR